MDWQDVMIEHFGKDWVNKTYNIGDVGKLVQKLMPNLISQKEKQIVAEVLAEKIVDLGADIAKLDMTVKLIKENTGFYDSNTDRYVDQIASLSREREELTEFFLKVYKP